MCALFFSSFVDTKLYSQGLEKHHHYFQGLLLLSSVLFISAVFCVEYIQTAVNMSALFVKQNNKYPTQHKVGVEMLLQFTSSELLFGVFKLPNFVSKTEPIL